MDRKVDPGTQRLAVTGAVVGSAALLVWLVFWWSRPPQMGGDKETARAVDALFTAVTARDERLLGQCEQRLCAHREAGNLLPSAMDYLNGIITEARSQRWDAAAERLYNFMKAQRRERIRQVTNKPA